MPPTAPTSVFFFLSSLLSSTSVHYTKLSTLLIILSTTLPHSPTFPFTIFPQNKTLILLQPLHKLPTSFQHSNPNFQIQLPFNYPRHPPSTTLLSPPPLSHTTLLLPPSSLIYLQFSFTPPSVTKDRNVCGADKEGTNKLERQRGASQQKASRGGGRGGAGARRATVFGQLRAARPPRPRRGRMGSHCAARTSVSRLRVLQQKIQDTAHISERAQGCAGGRLRRPVAPGLPRQATPCCHPQKPWRAHLEGQNLLPGEHIGAVVAAKVAVRRGVDVAAAAGGTQSGW